MSPAKANRCLCLHRDGLQDECPNYENLKLCNGLYDQCYNEQEKQKSFRKQGWNSNEACNQLGEKATQAINQRDGCRHYGQENQKALRQLDGNSSQACDGLGEKSTQTFKELGANSNQNCGSFKTISTGVDEINGTLKDLPKDRPVYFYAAWKGQEK